MDLFHIKENAEQLQEDAKVLADAKIKYYKLWLFKLLVRLSSAISHGLIVGVFALTAIVFLAFAAAWALGELWHNMSLGFLCTGGILALVTLGLYLWTGKKLQKWFLKKLSDIYFKED